MRHHPLFMLALGLLAAVSSAFAVTTPYNDSFQSSSVSEWTSAGTAGWSFVTTGSTKAYQAAGTNTAGSFSSTLPFTNISSALGAFNITTRFKITDASSGGYVGLAAFSSTAIPGASYYLGDVSAAGVLRLIAVGTNTDFVAPVAVNLGAALNTTSTYTLRISGNYTGSRLTLQFTVSDGVFSKTITATDPTPLTGQYFGLRLNNSSASDPLVAQFSDFASVPAVTTPYADGFQSSSTAAWAPGGSAAWAVVTAGSSKAYQATGTNNAGSFSSTLPFGNLNGAQEAFVLTSRFKITDASAGGYVGFAAFSSTATPGASCYLADISAAGVLRIAALGTNADFVAPVSVNLGAALNTTATYTMKLVATYGASGLNLSYTVSDGTLIKTVVATDPTPLIGEYFGLRLNNASANDPLQVQFLDFKSATAFTAPYADSFHAGSVGEWSPAGAATWSLVASGSTKAYQAAGGNTSGNFSSLVPVTNIGPALGSFNFTTDVKVADTSTGAYVGLAAFSETPVPGGAYYLADISAAGVIRLITVGTNSDFVAPATVNFGAALNTTATYRLRVSGIYTGASLSLHFTVSDGTTTKTIIATDPTPLTGQYFGFRLNNSAANDPLQVRFSNFAGVPSLQSPTGGVTEKPGLVLLSAGARARPYMNGPGQIWRLGGNWYYGQQEVVRTAGLSASGVQSLRFTLPRPTLAVGESLRAGLIVVTENSAPVDLQVYLNGVLVGGFPGLTELTTFKQFHSLVTGGLASATGATVDVEVRATQRTGGDRINVLQLGLGDAASIATWQNTWDFPALAAPPTPPNPATIKPYRLATGAPWNGVIYYSRRVRDQAATMSADALRLQQLGFTATFQDIDPTISINSLRQGLNDNAQFNSSQKWQLSLFRNHGMQMAFNVYRLQPATGEDFFSDLPLLIDSSGGVIGAPRYPKFLSSPVIEATQTQTRLRQIWTDLAIHYVATPNYLQVRGEDGVLHPVFLLWSPFFFDFYDGHVASYDNWAKTAWTAWQQTTYGSVPWPQPPVNKTNAASWNAWQAFRGEYIAKNTKIVADIIREKVPNAWFAVLMKQHNFVQAVGPDYVSVGVRGLDPRHYAWADFVATETHRFGIYSVLADLDLARDMPSRTARPIFIHYLVGSTSGAPYRYPWSKRELVGSMLLRRALAVQYGYNERDDFGGFAYQERPDPENPARLMWPEVLPDIQSGNTAYNTLFDRAQATAPTSAKLAIHLPASLYTIGDGREDWNAAIMTPHRELIRRNLAPVWLLKLADLDTRPEITALVIPDPITMTAAESAALTRFTNRGGRIVFVSIPEAAGTALGQLPDGEPVAPYDGWAAVWDAGTGKVALTTLAAISGANFGANLATFVNTPPRLGASALDVETGLIGAVGDQVLVAVNHATVARTVTVTIAGVARTVTIPANDSAFFQVGAGSTLTAILPPPAPPGPVGPTLRDPDVWSRYREYLFLSAGEVD